jgi:hypothetical protein
MFHPISKNDDSLEDDEDEQNVNADAETEIKPKQQQRRCNVNKKRRLSSDDEFSDNPESLLYFLQQSKVSEDIIF